MRRFRVLGACSTVAIAILLVLRARGQGPVSPRAVIDHFGPPAIESGIRPDMSRSPDSLETRKRLTLRRASASPDRVDSGGRRYLPGRVILKFHDGVSDSARVDALAAASQSARVGTRPDYADFDIVSIDPNEDPDVVARALRALAEVEYAQPSYRMRPNFKPNDAFYGGQRNLTM